MAFTAVLHVIEEITLIINKKIEILRREREKNVLNGKFRTKREYLK